MPTRFQAYPREEDSVDHLFVHCRWLLALCHLPLSSMVWQGATSNYKRYLGGMAKKAKEELGTRSLEIHAIGYLVDFEANVRSI